MWKYQLTNGKWKCVWDCNNNDFDDDNGSPSQNNKPSGRYGAVGWFDSSSQELWIFGGKGIGNTSLNISAQFLFTSSIVKLIFQYFYSSFR